MLLIVLIVAACLIGSFLCSLMEASLYSMPRARIETMRRQGDRKGEILAALRDRIDEPIAAILILNTIMNTAGAAWAGALVADRFGSTVLGVFTGCLTLSILVFSEIIPKSLGFKFASRVTPYLAYPLQALVYLFWPAVKLCVLLTNAFGRRSRLSHVPEDDIISLATMSVRSGSIRMQEAKWISNALHLDKVNVRDIMTPASVVRRVSEDMPLKMTRTDADHWRFSRIPVYRKNDPDHIVGVVQRRHVFHALVEDRDEVLIGELMDKPIFVDQNLPSHELLNMFVHLRKHLFCVRDARKKWVGIVTLEDVLEALLGTEIVGEQDLYEDMQAAAREVEQAETLTRDLRRGGGVIAQVTIAGHSIVVGKQIREAGLPSQALVGPIVREGTVIVARSEIRLEAGDRLTLIGKKEDVEQAKRQLEASENGKEPHG